MLVSLVTGTRPQIVKSAPVLKALEKAGVPFEFVHTGQHYDFEMSGTFVEEFGLGAPLDLGVGSGEYIDQLYLIMKRLSEHYAQHRPDYMIVPGDTTSALGAGLVGFKLEIPVFHLESGLRRYDLSFQEEMNRRLLDHGSSGLFAPTATAVKNLELERVLGRIFHIGDTMYDILKQHLPRYSNRRFRNHTLSELGLDVDDYAVVTVHRRESVDDVSHLAQIVSALNNLDFPVIFPMHPRTQSKMSQSALRFESHVHVVSPLGYDEFMSLVAASKLMISDSGGIQKECYLLNVPQVSLQTRTEWVETCERGANRLVPLEKGMIVEACKQMYGKKLSNDPSVYGDGRAAERIPPIITSGDVVIPTDDSAQPYGSRFRF